MLKKSVIAWLVELIQRSIVAISCTLGILTLLQGCSALPSSSANASADAPTGLVAALPAGFFVPTGFFSKSAGAETAPITAAIDPTSILTAPTTPRVSRVLLYASSATQAYFETGGLDAKVNTQLWETFLRKYKIPFQRVDSADQLEKAQPGVLVLPSAVALSERERRAIVDFRARGGGILSSWLTGVRSEKGAWLGFDFMASALDVKVIGDTQANEDDNFMMPYGDTAVTHSLPAGLRIWLDRPKEWYPLRLLGAHPAAQIMDWSRTMLPDKQNTAVVFDERKQTSGLLSRSVVLGYPERLWLSSDPKALEAIAHNALMWLLRQPDAYISAWPHPYASAMVLAVDSPDVIVNIDLDFAKSAEAAGGWATYYVLTENAVKSADTLKALKSRGHEIAYLAEHYVGFKRQSSGTQAKRLDTMRDEMKTAGVEIAANAGFHAPMESYDKVTERLLMELGFDHYVSFMDVTDARLPFFAVPDEGVAQPANALVVLPRTQGGPEDSEDDGGPENVLKTYLAELNLSEKMAALSVVRIPNQTMLGAPELAVFFKDMKARHDRMWMATGGQIANWWRERDRVSISLDAQEASPLLTVTIAGNTPLQKAVTVLVNLPEAGSALRLVANDDKEKMPKIASVDNWRAALVLQGLAPGTYRWHLHFDHATSNGAK